MNSRLDNLQTTQVRTFASLAVVGKHTSGGIAIDHIATPAVPPARMTAPRLSSDGDEPAGVNNFFVTSYAAKYLAKMIRQGSQIITSRHT